MTAGIVFHLAVLYGLAIVECRGLQVGASRGVDFYLQRNAKLTAITEHGVVYGRQAGGPDILIEARGEGAVLGETIGEIDPGSVADGPVPAADAFARLEQCAGVA